MQEALLHSQAVFQRQASVVEQAVLARAFWVGVALFLLFRWIGAAWRSMAGPAVQAGSRP